MNLSRSASVLGLVAMLAAGPLIFSQGRTMAADRAESAGLPAPAWKLKDLAGREVSSEQFRDKVVVVDFWATWCAPCIAEIPGYIALQKKYGPDKLAVIGISMDRRGPAHVKEFAEAHGMNYTVLMGDEAVAEAFGGLEALPTTFLISREGRILDRKIGAVPHEEYEKRVQSALK